jgi:flagellar basal body-associated protein FliL
MHAILASRLILLVLIVLVLVVIVVVVIVVVVVVFFTVVNRECVSSDVTSIQGGFSDGRSSGFAHAEGPKLDKAVDGRPDGG